MMTDAPSAAASAVGGPPTLHGRPVPSGSWFAGLGTVAGLGALAASSCCALPVALAGLGATGAVFGGLAMLSYLRPLLLGGAALALFVGWGLFLRRRATACDMSGPCSRKGPSWGTVALLGLGTVLVGLSLVWEPYLEPVVLKAMR